MQVIQFSELPDYLTSGKDFMIELGEQTGIGSSSLLVHKCDKTFLIDRGIAFEGYGAAKVTTFPAGGNLEGIYIDGIIFTHVHADHSGLILPTLMAHPESRVFFSRKTFEELKVVLEDTLSVQKKMAKAAHYSGIPAPVPMFSEQDYADWVGLVESDYYEVFDTDNEDVLISFEEWTGWEFGFTFSGHTKGAFVSVIKSPDGDGLVFSGDLSGHDQETTKSVETLSESFIDLLKLRECKHIILVIEATNGDRDRDETLEASDARLETVLVETELRGGQALFPVFMVNRGPNIVAKLVRLGFKVFVAGGVRKTLAVEVGKEHLEKWLADGTVMFIQNGPNYKSMLESAVRGDYGFRPIVTSSATIDQGAVVDMAVRILPGTGNVLISTGHVFDGSAMQDFFKVKDQPVETGRTIVLNQMFRNQPTRTPVNVRCRGEHIPYSAHSYRSELVTFVTGLKPDIIFVKHCTKKGFLGLQSALQNKLGDNCPPITQAEHLHLLEF